MPDGEYQQDTRTVINRASYRAGEIFQSEQAQIKCQITLTLYPLNLLNFERSFIQGSRYRPIGWTCPVAL